jgi:hypothetical protein
LNAPREFHAGQWCSLLPLSVQLRSRHDARRGLCIYNIEKPLFLPVGLMQSRVKANLLCLPLNLEVVDHALVSGLRKIVSDINLELDYQGWCTERVELPNTLWVEPSPLVSSEEEDGPTMAKRPKRDEPQAEQFAHLLNQRGHYWCVLTVYGIFLRQRKWTLKVGLLFMTQHRDKAQAFLDTGHIQAGQLRMKEEESENEEEEAGQRDFYWPQSNALYRSVSSLTGPTPFVT